MELVRGLPITDYCDQARLPADRRLRLFTQVCRAVQHAHQKGVIHRDLKPSNILVTLHDGEPVPKVIDFGIAKAMNQRLTDKTVYTRLTQFVGTPQYMSPEQAELSGLDIDTRSDVYSLGVLLYELLTGTTPFDPEALRRAGLDEVRRMIREDEPPRPSARVSTLDAAARSTASARRGLDERQLGRLLRGDLDWIVMRALEKDRNRRYESAGAFAADVERYLADEPVEARPPSVAYRLRKLARRHKAVVTSSLLVGLVVFLGSGISVWKYLDEREARRDADDLRRSAERNAAEAQRQTAEAERAKVDALKNQQDAERQRKVVAQNLYYSDIRLGLVDWTAGNLARLSRKLVDHVPPSGRDDLRGWEWYYLLSLCHQEERTLMDHRGQVTAVAWSPDGRHVASTSYDGTARVWDTTSWRLLRTFHTSRELKHGVAWSPDGQWLAWGAVAGDNAVYLWRVGTDEIKDLRGHASSVWAVAWSPDGRHLASGGLDRTIRIWDLATSSCLRVFNGLGRNIAAVAWSPDGHRLASASEHDGVTVWEAASGQLLRDDLYRNEAKSVAWSPDGAHLAVGTREGECLLYRTADWSESARWDGHKGGTNGVAWDPEGRRVASAGADGLVRLWDPAGASCLLTLRGHLSQVLSVAWEPGGGRLASAGMDGTVKVWAAPAAPQPRRLGGSPGGARAIAWGDEPDTLRAFDGQAGSVTVWDVATGRERGQTPVAGGRSGQFSPGGRLLAVAAAGDDPPRLLVCDARSGLPVQTVKALVPKTASFSPDASRLAAANRNTLEVIDLRRNEIQFRWTGIGVRAVSWSPDGRHVAVAGRGEESDGGTLAHAGWVQVFDPEQRRRVWKLRHGASRVEATAVTWSPDGGRLVSGDVNGLAEVWEMSTGRKAASAQLHTARIEALAWSPDGRRVASGSRDRTVRVWDPTGGEELLRFDVDDAEVTQLVWSPDGRRLAAACADGTVLVWDASAGYGFVNSEAYAREQARARWKEADELWDQGRKDDALALRVRTLEEQKATLGPDHDDTLWTMDHLGRDYRASGRHAEAIGLAEQALEKRRAKLGPDHDDTVTNVNALVS
jgi:WD40 repeat protein